MVVQDFELVMVADRAKGSMKCDGYRRQVNPPVTWVSSVCVAWRVF